MNAPFSPDKLPPADLDWSSFISVLGDANRALKDFNGILRGLVNPGVLLSPITTQEAVLSSRIEGTKADLEDVLEYEADPNEETDPEIQKDIQEILNYRNAMMHAENELQERPLNLNLIQKIHSILLDSVRGKNKRRGKFRRDQVWIGQSTNIGEARYIPPDWQEIEPLMDNLEHYIHEEEKNPLVQLALLHGQFEVIHPFLDGNGRVGRILIPLFLFEKGILTQPMFYVSAYLEGHRQTYYDRLLGITKDDDWNRWILFFLKAISVQAKRNLEKAEDILNLYEDMKERISDLAKSKYTIQALDALFEQPLFSTSRFKEVSDIPRGSADRIIRLLREEQILKQIREGSGRKPALYIFPELMSIVG